MTRPQLPALRPAETLPAVAWPKPPAHVEPYVAALGPARTVEFLLRFGGAEMHLADRPRDRSAMVAFLGREAALRLAAVAHRLPRRTPLANPWLARCLHARGVSIAEIARRLRCSDVTVRGYLRPAPRPAR